ncbi:MAG: hypothetical protein R3A48_07955 [Polyangiales bacterium]
MSEPSRWRVTAGDVVALAAAVVALGVSAEVLERARGKTDSRRELVRAVRAEAGPRDLVFVAEDSPETLEALAPLPSLWGVPPTDDLQGVRRVYGLAATAGGMGPYFARFGPGRSLDPGGRAAVWDLAAQRLARVTYDANTAFADRVAARREGGADAGDCPRVGNRLTCKGPEWNHLRAEPHTFDGAPFPCVYAHPHADGDLVISFERVPASRALVGTLGIDDVAYFPGGAPVNITLRFTPDQGAAVERALVAANRKGVTPYRLELPDRPGSAVWRISSPNIASRQLCFTMRAVR